MLQQEGKEVLEKQVAVRVDIVVTVELVVETVAKVNDRNIKRP